MNVEDVAKELLRKTQTKKGGEKWENNVRDTESWVLNHQKPWIDLNPALPQVSMVM